MAALDAKQQARLVEQLKSTGLQDVQAGLSQLQPVLSAHGESHEPGGRRFKHQLPVLAAALPQIVPCPVQHAGQAAHPRLFRLKCL